MQCRTTTIGAAVMVLLVLVACAVAPARAAIELVQWSRSPYGLLDLLPQPPVAGNLLLLVVAIRTTDCCPTIGPLEWTLRASHSTQINDDRVRRAIFIYDRIATGEENNRQIELAWPTGLTYTSGMLAHVFEFTNDDPTMSYLAQESTVAKSEANSFDRTRISFTANKPSMFHFVGSVIRGNLDENGARISSVARPYDLTGSHPTSDFNVTGGFEDVTSASDLITNLFWWGPSNYGNINAFATQLTGEPWILSRDVTTVALSYEISPSNKDCVGRFQYEACTDTCGDQGIEIGIWETTQLATGSGTCPYLDGDVVSRPCRSQLPCPQNCTGHAIWVPCQLTCVPRGSRAPRQIGVYAQFEPSLFGGTECPYETGTLFDRPCDPAVPACSFNTTLQEEAALAASASRAALEVAAVCLAIFLLWLLLHFVCTCAHPDRTRPTLRRELRLIMPVIVTFFDVVTDVVYALYLSRLGTARDEALFGQLAMVGMGAITLSFLVNAVVLLRALRGERNSAFWQWFGQGNELSTTLVFFIGSFNISLVPIVSSNLLGLKYFAAPLDGETRARMQVLGLISNVLEDFPQLCVQGIVIYTLNDLNEATLISMSVTVVSLALGVSRRALQDVHGKELKRLATSRAGQLPSDGDGDLDLGGGDAGPDRRMSSSAGGDADEPADADADGDATP